MNVCLALILFLCIMSFWTTKTTSLFLTIYSQYLLLTVTQNNVLCVPPNAYFVLTISADRPTHGQSFAFSTDAESVEFDTDAVFDEYRVTPLSETSETTLPPTNDFSRSPVETDNAVVNAVQTRSSARQFTATPAAAAAAATAGSADSPDTESATAINPTSPALLTAMPTTVADADTPDNDTDSPPFTNHPLLDDETEPNYTDNPLDTDSQTDVLTFEPEISISVSDYETDHGLLT